MVDLPNLPRVIGHRGAMAYAPENTLAGIREAARRGTAWVEFDVRLSADGVPLVIHDSRLERTTSGKGPVSGAGYAQISKLDAGAWFASEFAGERVPRLGEAIRLAGELGLGINVELKPARRHQRALCAAVLKVLAEGWPKRSPPALLSSFDRVALAELRDLGSPWASGLLVKTLPRNWSRQVAALGCVSVHAAHNKLSRARAEAVKSHGLALAAYTLDDPVRAQKLFAWGVDAVFSNAPDILMAGIGEK